MASNLPKGWIETTFDDVADATDYVANGSFESLRENVKTTDKKDYAILVRLRDYNKNWNQNELVYVDRPSYEFLSKSSLKEGDLFIANVGAPGKSFIVPNLGQPMTIGPNGLRIRANETTTNKFLFYYYNSPQGLGEIEKLIAGSAQQKFNKTGLRSSLFLLPPLPEQQRIVEKLDALMARISNSKTRLEKIPTLLKNFRQSVLAAAVSGELTKEWRKENEDIQEAKTKSKKKERKNILDDKVDDYDLYELPVKWNWKTISDVSDVKGGKRVPKGHKLVSYDTGLPYIKAGDLKKGTVLKDKLEYLLPETQKLIKRYIISKGDAYITNVGAKIGDAGLVPDELDGANLTENALKMCNLEGVINFYLSLWLQSPIAQGFIQKTILSAAQGKLALGRVEVFPIPLPPIEEQKEIVRKVEELFHFADSIETRYQKAKAWFDKLPQSILAKAFRGELVPQNENDEPASELLKRIQQAKQTNLPAGKAGHKPSSKAKKGKLYEDNDQLSLVAEE